MVVRTKATGTTNGSKDSKSLSFSSPDWSDEEHDFSSNNSPSKKAKLMLFSETGVGKTDFICRNAPEEIAIFDFDGRSLRTVEKVRAETGKVIHHVDIFLPGEEGTPEETRIFALDSINKTIRNLKWCVKQSLLGKIKVIGFDGASEYQLLSKLAYDGCKTELVDGKIKELRSWGKDIDFINHQFWRIFNICRRGNAHLIITSREKEVYDKEHKATGDFTFRASKVINEAVDFSLQLKAKDKLDPGSKGKKYEIEVIKAGVDDRSDSKVGKIYKEKDWQEHGPFALICSDVYGGDVTDWL
jgi:hypothetical protein